MFDNSGRVVEIGGGDKVVDRATRDGAVAGRRADNGRRLAGRLRFFLLVVSACVIGTALSGDRERYAVERVACKEARGTTDTSAYQ